MGVGVEEPLRPDVVVLEEVVAPRIGVDDEAVPLHEQRELGVDVRGELLHHEARVRLAREDRRDAHAIDRRDREVAIGDEQHAREGALAHALLERGQRKIVVGAIDAAEGDARQGQHGRDYRMLGR